MEVEFESAGGILRTRPYPKAGRITIL